MKLIDTHCHFDEPDFDSDRSEITQQMKKLGISSLILPATMAKFWPRIKQTTVKYPYFYASYGLHPIYLEEHSPQDIQELRTWIVKEKPVAIGECGLDFYLPNLDREQQESLLVEHLKLASEFHLPLIIHARRSVDIIIKHLRRFSGLSGVIHSFAGSQQQADFLVKLGFYLGVGGTITYERAQRLRAVVTTLDLANLVLETDAPDQPDSQWRGKRNEPTRLPLIAATLAELRDDTIENIAAVTTRNAIQLFRLPIETA